MTPTDDRRLPAPLHALASVEFPRAVDEGGIEFEPYPTFLPTEETTAWFRAWTGNGTVTGDAFRVFGEDGAGGLTALWIARPDAPLADQPVVHLGSEGEMGVVARDLPAFLWLLADGFGPWEAVDPRERNRPAHRVPELVALAERFAPERRQSARTVMDEAAREFPDFEDSIDHLCA
ncbi:SMI1/KNR4 family protein [Streptomyces huiliensis]|uniref:SMI1/KNR4 family protein n=1 Tax=Streptomyces huiliensis TaxID=2876027 RepID=UPI001CBF4904|nr:SMI1/KNR4 family protein [Streptomyces huiliensis]MBZ4318085.1 SMI1/KNR4 family protein [Streptomyces huiliensis]